MVFLNYFFTLIIFILIILAAEEIGRLFLKAFNLSSLKGLEKRILAQGIGLGFLAIFIFFIGLLGYLQRVFIWLPIIILGGFVIKKLLLKSVILNGVKNLARRSKCGSIDIEPRFFGYHLRMTGEELIFIGFIIINLIGVFAPEIGFDALYYHLTLPKIYLMKSKIFPLGGLFEQVSPWPKLTEMLYLFGISLNDSSLARLFHFYFGIMTAFLVFFIGQRFLNKKVGILASLAFYSMPTVSWFSTSGYVDLALTFYLTLASYLIFSLPNEKKSNILTGLIYGFALGTKLSALVYLLGFLLVFFLRSRVTISKKIKSVFFLWFGLLITALPWYFVSFLWTGNPVYPFFKITKHGRLGIEVLSLAWTNRILRYSNNFYKAFFKPDDYLTPLPLIFLPLTFVYFNKLKKDVKFLGLLVFFYSFVLLIFSSSSNRYLLPLFPLLIIFSFAFYSKISQPFFKKYLVFLTIFISSFCLFYRTVAILPRVKVFLGLEEQNQFLTRFFPKEELVFIDKEGFFRNLTIKKEEPVLVIGSHQLFYIDFPFEHISWAPKTKIYSYILVQGDKLPDEFRGLALVYEDKSNNIKLYKFGKSLK